MHNKSEIFCLTECRRLIEARLCWGDSELWTSRDFEMLSEKIREATDVHLSVTTLKRIWGKVKYDSLPAVTTLDTLVRFIGYENWRVFRQANENFPPPGPILAATRPAPTRRMAVVWTFIGLVLAIITLSFYFTGKKTSSPIDASRFQFTSKKVLTEGVPNSVIFDYDATASPFDSVYIQQNWDPSRRKKVAKDQRQYTSVYYYPGYFQAKLIIGQQIVKEHDLMIKTKGWLPIIEQTPIPVYFPEEATITGKEFGLSPEQIKEKNVSLQPQTPWVRYSNIGNWGSLKTDSFRLEATIKNDYREGSAICQYSEVRILCVGSAIIIPLCNKGCVSEISVMALDKYYNGKEKDLSFLGVDFSKWVHVVCEGSNGQLRVSIDNRQVFQSPLPSKPIGIAGIDFRFQGTGRIKDVKLGPL